MNIAIYSETNHKEVSSRLSPDSQLNKKSEYNSIEEMNRKDLIRTLLNNLSDQELQNLVKIRQQTTIAELTPPSIY